MWQNDSCYVLETVEQINQLQLPVHLHLTSNPDHANMRIYFGDYSYLKDKLELQEYKPFRGIGLIDNIDNGGYICSAKIGIANNAASYSNLDNTTDSMRLRRRAIHEEIFQALGITGDSFKYYSSIVYEGGNNAIQYSEIDKNIMRLLYEPTLKSNYSIKDFENDFSGKLHHIDAENKIREYIEQNNIPIEYLQFIYEYCMRDGILYKHPATIPIKLQGHFNNDDMQFCIELINLFNSNIASINFELAPDDSLDPDGIIIIFRQIEPSIENSPNAFVERNCSWSKMMFPYRVKSEIILSASQTPDFYEKKDAYINAKNEMLANALYKSLGFESVNERFIIVDSLGMRFNAEFPEILSFLYEPVIYSGITSQELDNAIQKTKMRNTKLK